MNRDAAHRWSQYTVRDGEELVVAVHNAFTEIGVDPFEMDTHIESWVDIEAIELLLETPSSNPEVEALIWNREVQITPQTISIAVPAAGTVPKTY